MSSSTVLLLPGGMCSAAFYDDVIAEPGLAGAELVARTLPGNAGTPAPDDVSVERYATDAAKVARDVGAAVVVGHSMGANVALEMAASDQFSGPLVLLAPSLSSKDESVVLRVLDKLATVFGRWPYALMLKLIGPASRSSLPPERADELIAVLKRNDPRFMRRAIRESFRYLDRYGSVAPRLAGSGVRAWVVFGEKDDVGITAEERRVLEAAPQITLVEIPEAGHMTPNTHPAEVAELIVAALSAASGRAGSAAPS